MNITPTRKSNWDYSEYSQNPVEKTVSQALVGLARLDKVSREAISKRHSECADMYESIASDDLKTERFLNTFERYKDRELRRTMLMAAGFDEETAKGISLELDYTRGRFTKNGNFILPKGSISRDKIQSILLGRALQHRMMAHVSSGQSMNSADNKLVQMLDKYMPHLKNLGLDLGAMLKTGGKAFTGIAVVNSLVDLFGENEELELGCIMASASLISAGDLEALRLADNDTRGRALYSLIFSPLLLSNTIAGLIPNNKEVPAGWDKYTMHDHLKTADNLELNQYR
jgi:hypothetical protein